MLGIGTLCFALLLGGCGGSDNATTPAAPGTPGNADSTTPKACATVHCAPTP